MLVSCSAYRQAFRGARRDRQEGERKRLRGARNQWDEGARVDESRASAPDVLENASDLGVPMRASIPGLSMAEGAKLSGLNCAAGMDHSARV